jgi:hypothetical protein
MCVVEDSLAWLRDEAVGWTRGSLHDDIALVLVEYAPATGRAGTFAPERTSSMTM